MKSQYLSLKLPLKVSLLDSESIHCVRVLPDLLPPPCTTITNSQPTTILFQHVLGLEHYRLRCGMCMVLLLCHLLC